VQPVDEGPIYRFKRNRKGENIYKCKITGKEAVVAVNTVRQNMSLYTKREIKQAEKAREYIRKLNFITSGELIKLLAGGKIKEADISVQDVVRSVNIW
jgi:transcriptional regulator